MQLKNECIRDILLTVEKNAQPHSNIPLAKLQKMGPLESYSLVEISYTLEKLKEAGFINVSFTPPIKDGLYYFTMVNDLTYEGHQFLDNIRDPRVWKETKSAASKVGKFSISILSSLAVEIAKDLLKLS